MDKVLSKICETTDYNKFEPDALNRKVSHYRVGHIVESLKSQKAVPPIEVRKHGKKLIIIDGQHRFEALKILNYPIPYFESYLKKPITTYDLYQRNKGQSWSTDDIIASYAAKKTEYQDLANLLNWTTKKLGRVANRATIELSNGINDALEQSYSMQQHDYKKGDYKILDEKGFKKTIEKIADFEQETGSAVKLKAAAYKAMYVLMTIEDLDINFLESVVNKQPLVFNSLMVSSNNAKDILRQILNFYNAQALVKGKRKLDYVEGVKGLVLKCKYKESLYLD